MSARPTSMRAAFEEARANLAPAYPGRTATCWALLRPLAWDPSTSLLVLGAPDAWVRDIAALRLDRLLAAELRRVVGRPVVLEYVIAEEGQQSC